MNAWNFLLNMNFENTCFNEWNLIFCSLFFFLNGAFMKEWNFLWKNEFFLLNLNFEFEWKCMFEYIKFDFLYCLKNSFMNAWKFDWIWISDLNENECFSTWNLIFFILLEECIYECVKFLWILWTKMHAWMRKFFLPLWYCSFFLRMHSWMHETLWILWMKMHAWMHEFFLSFWFCSFF